LDLKFKPWIEHEVPKNKSEDPIGTETESDSIMEIIGLYQSPEEGLHKVPTHINEKSNEHTGKIDEESDETAESELYQELADVYQQELFRQMLEKKLDVCAENQMEIDQTELKDNTEESLLNAQALYQNSIQGFLKEEKMEAETSGT